MIEDKLNRIIELLEKLVPQPITINSPISVKSREGKNVDISKHLYELASKISRRHPPQNMSDKEFTDRLTKVLADSEKAVKNNEEGIGKKEFIKRANNFDWSKVLKPKIKVVCKDEKGEIFTLDGTVKEDGSIVCEPMTESRTIVGWSVKKKVYKVRVFDAAKVFVGWLGDDGVVELVKAKHSISAIDKPFTYYQDWYITDNPNLTNRLFDYTTVTPKNLILEVPAKDVNHKQYPCKILENCVTGYITDDGRAVYYDQYL